MLKTSCLCFLRTLDGVAESVPFKGCQQLVVRCVFAFPSILWERVDRDNYNATFSINIDSDFSSPIIIARNLSLCCVMYFGPKQNIPL